MDKISILGFAFKLPWLIFRGLILVILVAGLASCSSTGPLSSELLSEIKESDSTEFDMTLISIDESTLPTIINYQRSGFETRFGKARWKPKSVIGVGDVVSIVVWEPSEQGLFANSATGNKTELGPFQIEESGKIPVPYIGYITAKGRTIQELRWAVQSQLQGQAVNPQVVVSITENASSQVAVSGDVKSPGRFPISIRGDKLLDVVAKAGGASNPTGETQITIVRGSVRSTQLLKYVYENPQENVFVRADDQIFLNHDPYTFTAFGAVPKVGEYPIETGDVSLVEAISRIGGLNDNQANPEGLFVFRYEDSKLLAELGLLEDGYQLPKAPVIYRLNLRKGKSFFFGQSFEVRDKDIIYVANSFSSELRKFIGILTGVTGVARLGSSL